jgi:putative spermidine/putrescine transport system ATP-binding protein
MSAQPHDLARSTADGASPSRAGVRVQLVDLRRRFGEVHALDGLSLDLAPGELVALLGPSGCGKTTALRSLAGLERLDSGHVLLDGRDITNVPASRRDMGMVFQAYSLFPNMTAEQNVEFGLRVRGRDRGDRRKQVAGLLELVGLSAAANRYPHQLSGGMQQRVALARALAIEPRVLLLDEPLSALDALVRLQLREEIRRVQTQLGITTLYVTHDQEEALSISDRVAVMSQGEIEQIGTPADIYNAPETPFVAEFIGTMNRLEATVTDADRGEVEYDGTRLAVDEARGLRRGERVLVLVRPETLELEPAADGATGGLIGEVVAHIFLGAITRLKVASGDRILSADIASAHAGKLPVGSRVSARFPSESARVLILAETPTSGAEDPAGP